MYVCSRECLPGVYRCHIKKDHIRSPRPGGSYEAPNLVLKSELKSFSGRICAEPPAKTPSPFYEIH